MPKPPAPSPTRVLLQTYRFQPRVTPRYLPSSHRALDLQEQTIPPYPYPRQYWYKQANFGLYGGLARRSGNNVGRGRNKTRTRRVFRPNIHTKRLWSAALGKHVRVTVATRVLRTIDKVGGLDEYLLGEKPARVRELGMGGWALRWRLMRSEAVRERMRAERERLGLEGEAPWEIKGLESAFRKLWARRKAEDQARLEEEGEGREEQLVAREMAIDGLLEEDERRAERGEKGGVLLHEPAFMEEQHR